MHSPRTIHDRKPTCGLYIAIALFVAVCTPADSAKADAWSFENVTTSVLNDSSLNSYYRFDAIWTDFNNDGLYDPMILAHNHVTNEAESTRLWVQNNDGSHIFSYVDHTVAHYILDGAQYIRGSRDLNNLDLNGDGKEDFILLDSDAQAAHYVNGTPDGQHTPLFSEKLPVCGSRDYCDVSDINGDGLLDIIHNDRRIVDALSGNELYPAATPSPGSEGTMLISDLEEDGWPDIIQPVTGGYWRNVGGQLTVVDAGFSTEMFTRSRVVADFDNDGDLDFFGTSGGFSDPGDGPHLYRNNGNGTFTDVIQDSGIADQLNFRSYWTRNGNAVAADFDNDGLIDIALAGTEYSPSVELIRNLGGLTFEIADIDLGPANMSNSAKPRVAVADYDNDGRLDILKTQSITNAGVWRNTTSSDNHWMQVRVRGQDKNTDGLGTCLRWYAPGTDMLLAHYHVNSNHSHAQKHPHAGLGSQTQVDLEVRFPHDGPTYAYQGLATNQEVIVYPNGCLIANWTPGSGWPLTPPPSNACIQPATDEPTPNISAPSDITVNAESASGTPATNTAIAAFLTGATAIDEGDGAISVTNDAPVLFPAGTTTPVHFSVTNSLDRTATASANVTVRVYDIEPPVITPPADITVDAQSGSGTLSTHPAIATFLTEATAIDNVDNTVDVTNNAPGQFPEGVTTEVIFSAADNAGNTATASSYVTVNAFSNSGADTTLPVVTPPADITVDAETASGTSSNHTTIAAFLAEATAIDNIDGAVSVTNNAPDLFPAGKTTEVIFSAVDGAGNIGIARAHVTVSAYSISVDGVYGGGGTFGLSLMVLLLFFGILHSKRKCTIHL